LDRYFARHRSLTEPRRGQALVEFALVLPVFVTVLMGFIEFVFVLNGVLATDLASRGAALAATEGGSDGRADCAVLKSIEDDLTAPADRSHVQVVEIFEASATGAHLGRSTQYSRSGSLSCHLLDGTALTLPYTLTQDGYPPADRCTFLRGCGGPGDSVDHVGVRIVYRHTWRTPFPALVATGPYLTIERSNVMRMEPEG
jgi:TadE-like protein